MTNPSTDLAPQKILPARLIYQPVTGFIEQVAAKSAAPGGGSVAALSGALGSALLTMVINFTVDKKDYAAVAPKLAKLKLTTEAARAELTQLIDKDTDAFNRYRAANKLPERDDEEKNLKATELARATMETLQVPEQTMNWCLKSIECATDVVHFGNVNTVSDAATGTELLASGVEGAAANVLINLSGIPENDRAQYAKSVEAARNRACVIVAEVRKIVAEKLSA